MHSSETDEKLPGCYAVKYNGVVWAAFNKEALLEHLHDVPKIEESTKYFDANPVFDESNPIIDPLLRLDLRAGDAHLKYLICDRTALEFQLRMAANNDGMSVLESQICNILVDKQLATDLLQSLLADEESKQAEDDWYTIHGEHSQEAYEESWKASGKKVGIC